MKHSTKRLISILICLALTLAVLPVAVFADGAAYYVAGNTELCGVSWDPGATQNKMSDTDGDGIYTITFTGISGTTHNFKVTDGTWTNSWGMNNDNYKLILDGSNNTVEIRFDSNSKQIAVFVNGSPYVEGALKETGNYYVAGPSALCGADWQADAAANKMTGKGNGVYTFTYSNVAKGDYALKVTDGTWNNSWGGTGANGNYEFSVEEDGSTVTVTFTFATKLVEVAVTAPAPEPEPEPDPDTLVAEGTATFATDDDAWNPECISFVPAEDGTVTVEISACDPGFYLEIWVDGLIEQDHCEAEGKVISVPVTKGKEYEFVLNSADAASGDPKAGSVTYKITADVAAGEPGQGDGSDGDGENSAENPMVINPSFKDYIGAGKTIWFMFDGSKDLLPKEVYSQILHINAGVPYTVAYGESTISPESEGAVYFVNYEMEDTQKQGKYLFSVTNNGSSEAFFTVQVSSRPEYVIHEYVLVLGDNSVVTNPNYNKTLYQFIPTETGVYSFSVSEGKIGNWGTVYNPVDNTGTNSTVIVWSCTDVGQSILIGLTGTQTALLKVERTGDCEVQEQLPETNYENTYGFTYQLPENPDLVPIDVLDDQKDAAVLDENGFYRYGSKHGPLMVTDLNDFPVQLADAITNGQLRVNVYENGKPVKKIDYNEAMTEYLDAGLVPVTAELAMMLQQLGVQHDWWQAEGFVFEGEAPADQETAWMVACSWVKGTELDPDDDNSGGTGGTGGTGGSGNPSGSNGPPKTADISVVWAVITIAVAGVCLVILNKKKNFFLC